MTSYEKQLVGVLLEKLSTSHGRQVIERLFKLGVINLRACEQLAMREQIDQLGRQGVPRCEAMLRTADQFCCSYEKVRSYYYNTYKF